jgi:hypothetical protein
MGIDSKSRIASLLVSDTTPTERIRNMKATCAALKNSIDGGTMGEIIEQHENLILEYYADVLSQAEKSFAAAQLSAWIGFGVLIFTILYVFAFDVMWARQIITVESKIPVGTVGIVSGIIIEFIAAITLVIYERAARQFSAFHVCLERMHRYLIGYKMLGHLKEDQDTTLRDLVCIMANAPMITRSDVERPNSQAIGATHQSPLPTNETIKKRSRQ